MVIKFYHEKYEEYEDTNYKQIVTIQIIRFRVQSSKFKFHRFSTYVTENWEP